MLNLWIKFSSSLHFLLLGLRRLLSRRFLFHYFTRKLLFKIYDDNLNQVLCRITENVSILLHHLFIYNTSLYISSLYNFTK